MPPGKARPIVDAELEAKAEEVRRRLEMEPQAGRFDPVGDWRDLGRLICAMEARGCYLMTNSAADPHLKRMAAFHRSTGRGFPCVGSSEWGRFPTHGEAVLRAAHAALTAPRA